MELTVARETWPMRAPFRIAYQTTEALEVVVVELRQGGARGRGEAAGVSYRGETPESLVAQIEAVRPAIEAGLSRADLQTLLPAGGARNAVDCALWDLDAKRSGVPAWRAAGVPAPALASTFFTLGIDAPAAMARAAAAAAARGFDRLKVKLGAEGDMDRIGAVRRAAPDARLIVDANGGWSAGQLFACAPVLADHRVELIEQPLAPGDDAALAGAGLPIPVCVDEGCQDTADLETLAGRYQAACIKLDKAGGLTEALRMAERARELGLALMVGNMCGTSLAMAPALLLAPRCAFVDLDGPLLNATDRPEGLTYAGSSVSPATPELWG